MQTAVTHSTRKRRGRPRATGNPADGHEAKRDAILDAASRLFMRKGYEATSVRDVAKEAGISQATLYHYMRSKPEILAAIHNVMADELLPLLYEVAQADLSPQRKLAEFIRVEMELIERHPTHTAAFRRERRSLEPEAAREMREKRDEADHILDQILEEGIQQGVFRPVNVKLARLAIMGMANHSIEWFDPHGPATAAEIAASFVDIVLPGLLTDCRESRANSHRAGTVGKATQTDRRW